MAAQLTLEDSVYFIIRSERVNAGWQLFTPGDRYPYVNAHVLPLAAAGAIIGILVARAVGELAALPWLAYVALALLIACAYRPRHSPYLVVALCACTGAARLSAHESDRARNDAMVRAAAAEAGLRRVEVVVSSIDRRQPDRLGVRAREGATGALLGLTIFADDGPLPTILPGDRLEVTGRLRPAVRYRLPGVATAARLDGTMSASADRVEILASGSRADPRRWAARAQGRLVGWVEARAGPDDGKAVLRAALTGDRGGMPEAAAGALRDAGAAHVLAVSGLHLAAVAGLVFWVVRRAAAAARPLAIRVRPSHLAVAIAAPVAILYTFVTGAQTSTVRALVMALAAMFGVLSDRRPRGPQALALAALALCLGSPHAVFQPAFQLSFAAAAALVFGGMRRSRGGGLVRRGLHALRSLVRASVLTAVATAPFTALAFGQIAAAGVVTNLVAVPLVSTAVLPLGLAGAALAGLWPGGGAALAELAAYAAAAVVRFSAAVAAAIPPWPSPPPAPLELAVLAAIAAGLGAAARARRPRVAAAAVAAAGLAAFGVASLVSAQVREPARGELRVTFLEVGQGDASLVELPSGEVWLIDAGGDLAWGPDLDRAERARLAATPGERAVLAKLRRLRVRALDRVIISHPHADHYAGLYALADTIPIRELWLARPHAERPPPPGYRALVARLALGGTRVMYPRLDRVYRHGEVEARVLAPRFLDERATEDPVLGANDNSLVVTLDYAGRRVLFAGDVEREAEALLLRRAGRALAADLVQVPHHGSKTSSTPAFVRAVAPGWAIISCGVGNTYGMPDPEVVARWRAAGAEVIATADAGSVTATIDRRGGMRVKVSDAAGHARARAGELPAADISLW
jgi:competence protein ComEC